MSNHDDHPTPIARGGSCRAGVSPYTRAVLALIYGAILWGLYWWPLRGLDAAGLPGLWAVAFIYLGAVLVGLLWARHQLPSVRRAPGTMAGIGLSASVSGTALSIALLEGHVARVLILFYLTPLWSVILGRLFLGERLQPMTLPALGLALLGALLMLLPSQAAALAFAGADLLGLLAGFAFALTNLQVRAAQHLPASVKNLAAWYLVPAVAAAWALWLEQPLPQAWSAIGVALLVGMVWMSSMVAAVQYGVTRLPLQRSAVILVLELVVGTVSAALLAAETLALREWLGGLLIVLAGLLVVRAPRCPAMPPGHLGKAGQDGQNSGL